MLLVPSVLLNSMLIIVNVNLTRVILTLDVAWTYNMLTLKREYSAERSHIVDRYGGGGGAVWSI